MSNRAQLALNLPHRPADGREDFFVTSCNKPALDFIDRWPNWPAPFAVLCGPPGCGKSHTIANIVCAYLAQGKRVLVTSKGAPALSVLRKRLPPCMQELVVDVTVSEVSLQDTYIL